MADRTVAPPQLADQTVVPPQLADQTVVPPQLADQTVVPSQLADQTVVPPQLADQTVVPPQLADSSLVPDVGTILSRLRKRHDMSLRDLADRTNLSGSFLSAVERGQSDISLGRLARIAAVFDHDVGSFLGFTGRRGKPHFLRADDQFEVDRGAGVRYHVSRVADLGIELVTVALDPFSSFNEGLKHEGIDVVRVLEGTPTLVYAGRNYQLAPGDCLTMSGAHSHTYRNETSQRALLISLVTEEVY